VALTDKRTLSILLMLAPAEHALHHRRVCDRAAAVLSTLPTLCQQLMNHDTNIDRTNFDNVKGTKMVKSAKLLSWFTSLSGNAARERKAAADPAA
jgi:hypothetical protein